MDGLPLVPIAQAKLQQHGSRANGRNYNHCDWAVKCVAIGEDHYQCEQAAEQSGGQYSPAAWSGWYVRQEFVYSRSIYIDYSGSNVRLHHLLKAQYKYVCPKRKECPSS